MPLSALHGDTGPPGEAAGFGLLNPQTARDLVAAAARNPNTRWCLTALHPDGTAAAHGCAAGPHPWIAGPHHDRDSPGEPSGPLRPPDQQAAEFLRALKLTLNAVIRGPCNHAQAQHRYRCARSLTRGRVLSSTGELAAETRAMTARSAALTLLRAWPTCARTG